MDKLWLVNQILKKAEKREVKPKKSPLSPIFIQFRDNNRVGEDEFRFEETRPKPAVEVGIGFTF